MESCNINSYTFTKDEPIDSQNLLLMVLPYESRNLMSNDIIKKWMQTKWMPPTGCVDVAKTFFENMMFDQQNVEP